MYKVNFLPPELLDKYNPDLRKLAAVLAVILAAAGSICWYNSFKLNLYQVKKDIAQTDRLLAQNQPRLDAVRRIKSERLKNQEKLAAFKAISENRFLLSPVFKEIERSIPVDTWLTEMTVEYRKELTPAGGFASPPGVGALPQIKPGAAVSPPVEGEPVEETQEQKGLPPPNALMLQGVTYNPASVGVFVQNLAQTPHFIQVSLKKLYADTGGTAGHAFTIELQLREEDRDAGQA